MKNREELIIDASTVIEEYKANSKSSFDLFFSDGKFSCQLCCHASMMSFFIRHFSLSQAVDGLTGPQWLRLGKKAAKMQLEQSL